MARFVARVSPSLVPCHPGRVGPAAHIEQLPSGSYRVTRLRRHRPADREDALAPPDREDLRRGQEGADASSSARSTRTSTRSRTSPSARRSSSGSRSATLEDTTRERYAGPDPALHPADVRAPPGREARRRAAGALLRPPAPLPRHVHRPPPRRPHLPPAEHQHHAEGALHHPRRPGTRRALAPPRREQGGDGRRPVAGAHRARPAQRGRGRAAAERGVERPGVGPAALADHAHRPAPRRDLSAALAAHRLRARPAVHHPQQRPAEGRPQGEAHQDRPGPQDRPRRAHRRAADGAPATLGAAPRRAGRRAQPRRVRLLHRARRPRRRTCRGRSASATASSRSS